MRLTGIALALVAPLCAAVIMHVRMPVQLATAGADDARRITAHLASVEAVLRSADTGRLDADRLRARRKALDHLHGYRYRGVYPHNHASAGRTPVFIDEHGTHCAVGYLIAMSGHQDLARRIATASNEATIAELAGNPELLEWLDANGMSVLEAAMIQPTYGERPRTDAGYDRVTVIASAMDLPFIAVNLLGGQEGRGLAGGFGLAIGVAQFGLGAVGWAEHEDRVNGPDHISRTSIAVNLGLGIAGAAFGLRRLLRDYGPEPAATDGQQAPAPEWTLAPWLSPAGLAGLSLALRF